MAANKSFKKINLSSSTFPYSVVLASVTQSYKISGTKTITTNMVIDPSGTPTEGMIVEFDYSATGSANKTNYNSGACGLTIFSTKIPYSLLAKRLKIVCEYNSAWKVYLYPSFDTVPVIAAEAINTTVWDGTTLEYDGTTDVVRVKDGGITHAKLAGNCVEGDNVLPGTLAISKLSTITRGSMLVGGADDAPTLLDAKTSGQVLVGDGTDIKSVAVSGDVTISAAGVVAIGASKVLSAMIKAAEIVNSHINAAAGIVFTKLAALTASKIPVINSSGFIEAGTVDAAKLDFIDVTAGTSAASKAVVLSASRKIDTIDITALKIDGTSVTATASELNYMAGVTSNVQTQLNSAASKISSTTLTNNLVAVAASLKGLYVADTSTGSIDVTLPKADTVAEGVMVKLLRVGANAASFKANAADTLLAVDDLSTDQAAIACSATGKSLTVVCNGVDTWQCIQKD